MNNGNKIEEERMEIYRKCNHIPYLITTKYNFDNINYNFSHMEGTISSLGIVTILYQKYFPKVFNSVFLCCANPDKMNAGYNINYKLTQEGQIFYDSDVFASDLRNLYPFKFDKELIYVENVTFHNHEDWQVDINSFRKNDIIFAASKKLNQPYETDFIKEKLENIIEAVFKIAILKKKRTIYLWPLGCGVFKNNPKIIAGIFARKIKVYQTFFEDITMVIHDKDRRDKSFNTFFIEALKKNAIDFFSL